MKGKSAVIVLRHVKQDKIIESTQLAVDRMSEYFEALNLTSNDLYVPLPVDYKERKTNEIILKVVQRLISKVEKEQSRVKKREEKEIKKIVDLLVDQVEKCASCFKSSMLMKVNQIQLRRRKHAAVADEGALEGRRNKKQKKKTLNMK